MADNSNPPSRRTVLTSVAASALAAATAFAASPAGAAHVSGRRATPAPETVALPNGIRPEGITSGPGTTYYVGSLADGRIVTGDLLTGTDAVLLPGAADRQIRGLYWDERAGLVWAVGNVGVVGAVGTTAHVWAVDSETGEIASDTIVPGAAFLNDLVVTEDKIWVTDSRVDRLTAIAVDGGGMPLGSPPTFISLNGSWPAGNGVLNNANGIRELTDGSLILNNSRVGGLWQVHHATGHTVAIPVRGGPGIVGGDGLELDGDVLYNVRGSGPNQVAVVTLSEGSAGWTAKWVGARMDETLDVPSTATVAGGWLWAVNARFGVPPAETPTAPYWITRLPAR